MLLVVATTAPVATASEHTSASGLVDLSLTADGKLIGHVQSQSDQIVEGVLVSLTQDGRIVARSRTQADGRFVFTGVTAGVYELSSQNWRRSARVWAVDAAPPATQKPTVIVLDEVVDAARQPPQWNEFALAQSRDGAGKADVQTTRLVSWDEPATLPTGRDWETSASYLGTAPALLPAANDDSMMELATDAQIYSYDDPAFAGPSVPEIVDVEHADYCCPPMRYSSGPTIGEAVIAGAIVTGVGVGIYQLVILDDRDRRPASP